MSGTQTVRVRKYPENNMRVLLLGVVAALTLSVSAASAQEAVYPRHGYAPYGYRYAYGYHHHYHGYHHRYARYRY
jgi:hypothetical protein